MNNDMSSDKLNADGTQYDNNQDFKHNQNVLPYHSFDQAASYLFELQSIDYFLAKECTTSLNHHLVEMQQQMTKSDYELYFHLVALLSQSLRNGHSCLAVARIASQQHWFQSDLAGFVTHQGYLFSNIERIARVLEQCGISENDHQLTVYYREKLFIRRYFIFEQSLSTALSEKISRHNKYSLTEIKTCINDWFESRSDKTIDWQKVAVANALNKNFTIIAGGPGTGKTYTVTKLLGCLIKLHQDKNELVPLKISLCAPTGKAAQRLSESIGKSVEQFQGKVAKQILQAMPQNAQTLHRLLGVIPNSPNFRHHEDNKLDIDVLLIDEVSMVDLAMMTRVFRALKPTTSVILLGDGDQLPSVAAGSVLSDLAPRPHSGYSKENIKYLQEVTNISQLNEFIFKPRKQHKEPVDQVTFLTQSRRFDSTGFIGKLAKEVISGQEYDSWSRLENTSDKDTISNQQVLPLLKSSIDVWLPKLVRKYYQPIFSCADINQAFSQLNLFRFLCVTRKGNYGVETINEAVKNYLVNQSCIAKYQNLYHGQPIMIGENDYRLGLYNGDVGIIWRQNSGHLMAGFEGVNGEVKWVIPSRLPNHETVYAMTIHKTQGSEFDHVSMILPHQQDNKLLSRELLYTGITRAKSILTISSPENVWKTAVQTRIERFSALKIMTQNKVINPVE